ncbi:hypothetical protein IFM89_012060 [Coptis chinensis]|uniref:F-box domain-containing protein n=1 Tax=Coptis chinensis TaxID=261450 RepID=A0A835I3C4_9MAGN|nr:hypothetical protein IFM89_012060 [Coptis chinensis]
MKRVCKRGETVNHDVPDEIMVYIMSKLPLNSIVRFKCACKQWCALIQDEAFIQFHFSLRHRQVNLRHHTSFQVIGRIGFFYVIYSIEQDGSSTVIEGKFFDSNSFIDPFVPACNGLVCSLGSPQALYVSNPVTNDSVTLPEPRFLKAFPPSNIRLGFGFDIVSKKYKVVGCDASRHSKIEVLALGEESWRPVEGNIDTTRFKDQIIHLNGMLYWFSTETARGVPRQITTFNLTHERFGVEISVPDDIGFLKGRHWLCEFEGCLCVIDHYQNMIDMWVLKTTCDNNKQVWVNRPIILPSELKMVTNVIPIADGLVLVRCRQENNYLCHYNQVGRVSNVIKVRNIPGCMLIAGKYEDSLVPVRSVC